MTPAYKNALLSLVLMGSILPMSSFAWHGNTQNFSHPTNGSRFDCPYNRSSQHVHAQNYQGRHKGSSIRTFGMTEGNAKNYMADIKKLLNITPKQEAAWNSFERSYVALAKTRNEHRNSLNPQQPSSDQKALEARSHWMNEHAKIFATSVQARSVLAKSLSTEQMNKLNTLIATGSLRPSTDRPYRTRMAMRS